MDQRGSNQVKRTVQSEAVPKKETRPIFVHSALDDYGLTAIEFRTFGRIARRQNDDRNGRPCDESAPKMARDFGVSARTITRALQVLADAGLVSEKVRSGYTTQRRINPLRLWASKEKLEKIRSEVSKRRPNTPDTAAGGADTSGPTLDTPAPPVRTPQQGAPQTPRQHEGIPSEGDPQKEIPNTHTVESSEGGGVCAEKIDRERYKRYARAQPNLKDPSAWATTAEEKRIWDSDVLEWEEAERNREANTRDWQARQLEASRREWEETATPEQKQAYAEFQRQQTAS